MGDQDDDDDQYDLYGGTPAHVKGSDTSLAAAKKHQEKMGRTHRRVLQLIGLSRDGLTCDSEEMTGLRHQSASARIRELVQWGHLEDSTGRRKTRSGSTATVWIRR